MTTTKPRTEIIQAEPLEALKAVTAILQNENQETRARIIRTLAVFFEVRLEK